MRTSFLLAGIAAVFATVLAGCATAPSGRSQLLLIGDAQMQQMGETAFERLSETERVAGAGPQQRRAQCVVDALVRQLPPQWSPQPWEVKVFIDDSANAFALPGGKIGIHTGLFDVARTSDELAAVVGHEIAHVVSRHGAERVSQQFAAETAMQLASAYAGQSSSQNSQLVLGLLGAGAQVGVLLPFSRLHEREADVIGQQLMADAGFDPAAAVSLWRNMQQAAAEQARPPELLSTHPNPDDRIRTLEARVEQLRPRYESARASGAAPRCA